LRYTLGKVSSNLKIKPLGSFSAEPVILEISLDYSVSFFDSSVEGDVVSVSKGSGGGVVIIVQPIHIHMTNAARTNRKTGIATAHQLSHAGQAAKYIDTQGAKNAATYIIATISEMSSISPPYV